MAEVIRTDWQWAAINQALQAGPDGLSADMYQTAAVAQVLTDAPLEFWPMGTIKGHEYTNYMWAGALGEYREMFEWDKQDTKYNRATRFFLPTDQPYPHDTEGAVRRNISEFGDLGFYIANILALYRISLADALPNGDGQADVSLRNVDEIARVEAEDSQAHWHRPDKNLVIRASNFFLALKDIDAGKNHPDVEAFFRRRQMLAQTAGELVMTMSVFVQARFNTTIADVFYQGLQKIERRAETGTTLVGSGDEREKQVMN